MSRTIMSDELKKENQPPQPLNYRGLDPQAREEAHIREKTPAVIGGLVAIFGTLFLSIHTFVSRPLPPRVLIVSGLLLYGALGLIALHRYRRYRLADFGQAVLVGIGIALLLDGLCYLTTRL